MLNGATSLQVKVRISLEMMDQRELIKLCLENNGQDRMTLDSAEVGEFVKTVKDIRREMIEGATGCIDSFPIIVLPLRVRSYAQVQSEVCRRLIQ